MHGVYPPGRYCHHNRDTAASERRRRTGPRRSAGRRWRRGVGTNQRQLWLENAEQSARGALEHAFQPCLAWPPVSVWVLG
jgi:hypothetical protein